eukprot:2048219-Ditylum_brightwellii.AAC.1
MMMYHQQTLTAMGCDLTQVHIITSLQSKGWMVTRLYDCISSSQDPSNKQWIKMRSEKHNNG